MTASASTRLVAVALLVSTSLLCAACREGAASTPPSPEGAHASAEEATVEPKVDPFRIAYGKVLDDIGEYDFQVESDAASKSYGYTLVQIEGQKYPYLLVQEVSGQSLDSIRIFAFDPKSQTVIAPDEAFPVGAASAGGYRGDLSISKKHPHLEFMTTMAGTGQTEVFEVSIKAGKVVKRMLASGQFDMLATRDNSVFEWTDIKDRSLLQGKSAQPDGAKPRPETKKATPNKTAPSKNVSSKANNGKLSAPMQALIKQKKAAGMLVIEGTLRQFKAEELFKYQNGIDPTPGHKDTRIYTILMLPSETKIEISEGDSNDFRVDTARMFYLENASQMDRLIGKKVLMAFDRKQTNWPTDASTPLGQPRSRGYEVLTALDD